MPGGGGTELSTCQSGYPNAGRLSLSIRELLRIVNLTDPGYLLRPRSARAGPHDRQAKDLPTQAAAPRRETQREAAEAATPGRDGFRLTR
jgi:hypothetical protein